MRFGFTPIRARGGKPGFKCAVSANPNSADFDPLNYNRFGRYLRERDKPAPAADVPVRSRRILVRYDMLSARLRRQIWMRWLPGSGS